MKFPFPLPDDVCPHPPRFLKGEQAYTKFRGTCGVKPGRSRRRSPSAFSGSVFGDVPVPRLMVDPDSVGL